MTCLHLLSRAVRGSPPLDTLCPSNWFSEYEKANRHGSRRLAAGQLGRDIGQEFATVSVLVQQPPVKHEVKMKDFVSWLGRQGRSPAEVMLKQKLKKILGKVNHART